MSADGTAEQWIKEGKGAVKWTRLSCQSFASQSRGSTPCVLAYNHRRRRIEI
jgi:hypothetical protein